MCSKVLEKENGRYITYSEHALKPVVFTINSKFDGYDTRASLHRKKG